MITADELTALACQICNMPRERLYPQAVHAALFRYLGCDRVLWLQEGGEYEIIAQSAGATRIIELPVGADLVGGSEQPPPQTSGDARAASTSGRAAAGLSTGRWLAIWDRDDFDEDAAASAAQILPLLILLHHLWGPRAESAPPVCDWDRLTAREQETLELLRRGLTARAIGTSMGISPRTVNKHLEHIYDKLGRHDRLLAAAVAPAL